MRQVITRNLKIIFLLSLPLLFTACSNMSTSMSDGGGSSYSMYNPGYDYSQRLPAHINTRGEKMVVVNPSVHAWGEYDQGGNLVHAGIVTAGGNWCPDINRPCRTSVGTFRVYSLGSSDCVSKIYPKPKGGGLMPYCMFFSGGQALHGSPGGTGVEDNISHGCVRMRISDAGWVRY